MPGMGGTQTLAMPGFYFDLAIQISIWTVVAVVMFVVPWTLRNSVSRFSQNCRWTTGAKELRGRGFLRAALGCMWILDGALQAQPAMAGNFATQVIAPLDNSQLWWLKDLIRWEVYLWQDHAVVFDVATVLIQIGLGITILAGKDTIVGRIGLWMSIGWALAVWVGGEALGGLFAPGASELFGAPGSVLVYAAAAMLLLLPVRPWEDGKAPMLIRSGLGVVLLFGAALQAIPFEGFWNSHVLSSMFSAMAETPQPGFLSAPIAFISRSAAAHSDLWNVGIIAVMAFLGVGLISGRAIRAWSWGTGLWLVIVWWLSQDFGFLGGVGTDPNLNLPLLTLLITGEIARSNRASLKCIRQVVGRLNYKNLFPRLSFMKTSNLLVHRTVAFSGLVAIAVGVAPALFVMPSAVGRPISLHVSPPPPVSTPVIPLGTMAGEINAFVQASKGRLEVSLQAPNLDSLSNPSSTQAFQLLGRLKTPNQRTERLNWLQCGQGCFVTNANWAAGINHLSLDIQAKGFTGGTATFEVPWPPKTNNTILHEVVTAMRGVRSMVVRQTVTSNTMEPSFTSSGVVSGAELLSSEPFGSGRSRAGVVVLGHTGASTVIAFDNPAAKIYIEMTVGSNYRIITERLVAPQHLILARFHYS